MNLNSANGSRSTGPVSSAQVYCDHRCLLGEGPLWHPERQSLLWCDIEGKKLLERKWNRNETHVTPFPNRVSGVFRMENDHVLIAADDGLYIHDLSKQRTVLHCNMEATRNDTRSNDGRVHPSGALWIGTMDRQKTSRTGSIYRYFQGHIDVLFPELCIPNSICFSPDGSEGFFADSPRRTVWRVPVDPSNGMPQNEPTVFRTFSEVEGVPDGSVTDSTGMIWTAVWGGERVQSFSASGEPLEAISIPVYQVTCPTFGGPNMNHIFVTTAQENMSEQERAASPQSGMTFVMESTRTGKPEPSVKL